jgi:acetyl-CoA C-acetyltransferase
VRRVAIVGVGCTVPRPVTPDVSYRELIYEAAVKAYQDAGIEPKDIDCFTACSEDFNEGTSIFDEYVPDQLGAPLKPVHTIGGDGIHGLAAAFMQVATGLLDTAVVEAHSKASNIVTPHHITELAIDPVFNRPLAVNPHYIAGLEMRRFLYETGVTVEDCAAVAVKNKRNALKTHNNVYGGEFTIEDVLGSDPISDPLTLLQVSQSSDVAVVIVLAGEERAKSLRGLPVWIKGLGWCADSPNLESRSWGTAAYAQLACSMAYKMAAVSNPAKEIDLFEIDDTYAYKELQHLEAASLCGRGESGKLTRLGLTGKNGSLKVNLSGGSLGCGHNLEATGLFKVAQIVSQLRGTAGSAQVEDAKVGLALSWRGVPTASGAVAILEK